ncbi:glycosyltransferase [Halorussus litoreus]|uniref:glycosyltransferase n=1 Tax=Halorussus litoreus TaxID=1710536 RepID=UPI0018E59DE0|nr:glycosyltransferase [Halorussus litoreus]
MTKVVHLSTAHVPFDTRIFHKQAKSLDRAGYDVSFVVHHDADETVDGIRIRPLGNADARLERWQSIPELYRIAKNSSADIYHFHDPELLPVGVALAEFTSGKVIYDVHEYYKGKILKRKWIPSPLRPVLSWGFPKLQRALISRFDAVITATEWMAEPLQQSGVEHIVPIRNFPLTDKINVSEESPVERTHDHVLVYVGGLRENRGLFQMVRLLKGLREQGLDVGLWLVGPFESEADEQRFNRLVKQDEVDDHVCTFGWIDYLDVFDYLAQADVGLAILDPEETEKTIATKIFEYMYVNLPVVASGTEPTEQYLPSDCGSMVPYTDTRTQVEVVANILQKKGEGEDEVGANGRRYVEEKYNWNIEKDRLLDLYDSLSSPGLR